MPTSGPRSCSKSKTATSETVCHARERIWDETDKSTGCSFRRLISGTHADSIFFDNDRTLFSTFKYVGSDFEADMALMKANPKVREWWAMTDGMQVRFTLLISCFDVLISRYWS